MNENFDSVDVEYMTALYTALEEEYVEKCYDNRHPHFKVKRLKGKKNESRSN